MRTASLSEKGFSALMILLMKTLTRLSGESASGEGGVPISSSPSPFSKQVEKEGMMMNCSILAFMLASYLVSWKNWTNLKNAALFHSIE